MPEPDCFLRYRIIIIIIITNEEINVAFSRRTARTRNSHKKHKRENVVSNSTEEEKIIKTYKRWYTSFYIGKIPRIRIGGPPLQPGVVLKWFYSPSRRNTFVGGTCALPSALLVLI